MTHGQWRILYPGADYAFGSRDLRVFNRRTPEFGTPDARNADTDRPRDDGLSFGMDFLGGQTISFDLGIRATSDAEVRQEASNLRDVWRADAVRLTPGAVAELRMEYAGRERVVYGRPRRFSPDYSDAAVNRTVSVLADFVCVDDLFYSPDAETTVVEIVPPTIGGLIAPLASPLTSTTSSDRSQVFTVGGERPAWPVFTIEGPLINPFIEVVGLYRIEFRTDLAYDQSVTIDTRPWARSIVRSDGQSLAGNLTRFSPRLQDAAIPPGTYEIAFGGIDPSGTAKAYIVRQKTYAAA